MYRFKISFMISTTFICFALLYFLLAANRIHADESSTIISIGIDLDKLLHTNRSTVKVAASVINGSTPLTNNIRTISDFSIIPNNFNADTKAIGTRYHLHFFQEAYRYVGDQCTNQTSGFSFDNSDPYAIDENLTDLFKRIKYTALLNYGYPKGHLHAVMVVDSKYSQDSTRSLIKAAAERAGLSHPLIIGRNVAATKICKTENEHDDDIYYLEVHFDKDKFDIAIVVDEDGANIFDTLAIERFDYTQGGSEIIPLLSSLLDRLIQNAKVPDNYLINQVIITSSEPLTLFQALAVEQLEAFLRSYFGIENLTFCNSFDDGTNRVIPREHRIAYSAAKYSRSVAKEQLDGGPMICCVELSPVHYGIAVVGGVMHPVIRMHSIVDGPKSAVFTTIMPQRQPVEIAVYRGSRLQIAHNTFIGSMHFQNDGTSMLNLTITVEVDAYSDGLILTVENPATGQLNSSTFINDKATIISEVAQFEKNWDPQVSDLNRFLDKQLEETVAAVISKYISTAVDSFLENCMKTMRYILLPASKKQQIIELIHKSEIKLVPSET